VIMSYPSAIIVSGGCASGADNFAKIICTELDREIVEFLPDLSSCSSYQEATKAYYTRNKQIAENADTVYALVSEDRTGGTENTIKHAVTLKKKVVIL